MAACLCGRSDCPLSAPLNADRAPTSTAAAPSAATWASPSLVLCTCGVSYRFGAAHSCVLNGTFFTTPATSEPNATLYATASRNLRSVELEERNARSLQRIAVALEKLVGVFVPEL